MKNWMTIVGALIVGLVLGGSALAFAQAHTATAAEFCVDRVNGNVQLAPDDGQCRNHEDLLTISGEQGLPGATGLQGPAGPAGVDGQDGAQGEPGIQGPAGPGIGEVVTVEESAVLLGNGTTEVVTATCPEGTLLLNGGHARNNFTNARIEERVDNSWQVSFVSDLLGTVVVWAYCADVT